MERECWANPQYLRRECFEVVGIPKEVEQKDLESKMLSVLEKVGCKIIPDNIEDCLQLIKYSDNVMIKFSRRKDCQHVFQIEKDVRNLRISVFMGKIKFI